MAPTLVEVLRLSTRFLAEHGSASPRLDAELLTAHALGLRRLDVYLQHDRPLDDAELEPVRALLRRRGSGEPVAYMLGEREFFGRPFVVTPDVLIPRPDTETLVERALLWARARAGAAGEGLRLADVGTGSGCIAATLAAELPGAVVVATDVSAAALEVATRNVERTGVAQRVTFAQGSFAEPLRQREPFDAVVSNPPYIATAEIAALMRDVRDFEPRMALDGGVDGLDAVRALVAEIAMVLRPAAAALLLEVDAHRAAASQALVAQALPTAHVVVVKDLAGHDRVVEAALA